MPINILMVEDSPSDALLTREALRGAKVANELTVIEDGEAALAYLRKEGKYGEASTPDLILLDLNLPRLDGREVLQAMRQDPELKRIPVVVLTTSDADKDVLDSYDLGANCYVTKPVDFRKFEEVVQSINSFWFAVVKLPPHAEGA